MCMHSHASALRAITAEYLSSLATLVGLGALALFVLGLILAGILLDAFGIWWWITVILISIISSAGGICTLIVMIITKLIRPRTLTTSQRKEVRKFADKLVRIQETVATPYPLLLIIMAKDIIIYRENRLLKKMVEDSSTLKGDFGRIRGFFRAAPGV